MHGTQRFLVAWVPWYSHNPEEEQELQAETKLRPHLPRCSEYLYPERRATGLVSLERDGVWNTPLVRSGFSTLATLNDHRTKRYQLM